MVLCRGDILIPSAKLNGYIQFGKKGLIVNIISGLLISMVLVHY